MGTHAIESADTVNAGRDSHGLARMDTISANRSALVLVDFQSRLMPVIHDAEAVTHRATRLADAARLLGIRVVGTAQNPRQLGPNVDAIAERCEVVVSKMHFDACADGLVEELDRAAKPPSQVVVVGCEAHVCLLQTALGLLRHQRRVWVVDSACGSRRLSDHGLAMQRLAAAGATVVSMEMVLFEWLHHCQHEVFRPILQIIKETDPISR